ncbi:T9SS type A sorting domain-containing protein [Rhodohalobacter sulfatireducens]|uniref:T9SS type A sorting domain-containing protein n=1 Tax=Rhodohalobacter sulfatireducens TaxID=2911366 RepID=A0ABS9KB46_9BACT|nr:T9SS type A sorting domain-containing protein [Rhodohalobacter sulfatireducens]MCG2588045.1 T9SS type A sorting domain-containing protein [Rhodohalobacter sulfatireducens]
MGRKLRAFFLAILFSVSVVLIGGSVTVSTAQILLENDTPLEVRFSQGASAKNESSVTVGLFEFETILSPEFTLANNQWQSYREANSEENYYVPGGIYGTAPGRVQLENSPYQTFFVASIQNKSEFSFGNFIVAFDFMYNFFGNESVNDFELKYKVNDGEWNNLPSGVIDESSLRSVEDAWSSFSLHLNIDDVYLRPSDTIHLMWTIDEEDPVTERIPMALQRMEIFPEKVEQNSLNRGDLIITEILPSSDVNGSEFEYVEIYNPGESSVSLKGIELVTGSGSRVIQQDIFVEPYNFTVISNVDISSLEGVENSYFYPGSMVTSDGGRVELERDGNLIASATYQPTESGVAVELNRVSQAYDGYSSMQDFTASQTSYFQELFGSPGVEGSTGRMFKKTLSQSGVYLVSFPGTPVQQLNRNQPLDFYKLDGTELDVGSIEPYTPVLVEKADDTPVSLFTEVVGNQSTRSDIETSFTDQSDFLSIPINTERDAIQSNNQSFRQAFPVTQVWNPQKKKFNLSLTNQVQTDYWTPLMVHGSVAELLSASENQIRSPIPDRYVEFEILPDDQESSVLSDVVMVGFMDIPTQYDEIRYDLPKLVLEESSISGQSVEGSQHLYLTSTLSDESYNSFTHLPQQIDKEYELGLGHQVSNDAGGAVLRWNISDKLPDEWVITIEDTFNGTVVNLREENEYRFRYIDSSENRERELSDSPKIRSINPVERPRFVVNVKPYESFSNATEEEEVPNSIELRPNYPNPFNPSTNINFYIPEERSVRVGVYNIVGQQVALLLDDVVQQGEHSLLWDASDKPSGIYIVQLETGSRIFTRKITLIK